LIKALIFDLDGVIVDTAHYHYLAWKRLAKEFNIDLTPDKNERLKGVSRVESLQMILDMGGLKKSRKDMELMAARKNEWFVEYVEKMNASEIFTGVKEMLMALKQGGYTIALASSSKNAQTVLERLGIENAFDKVVDGTMIIRGKPDPEIFLLAASQLEVLPSECIVFEDAEAGVEAALRAGMKCVGVGSKEQLSKADFIVSKTADFDRTLLTTL
jgi:beta-phosphoglucomutase